ncbi:hypothetical protein ACFS27_00210 [Promicromonospora vindobonensis]|uniref:Uncharacterized protein n=1 Tax=Promicromonospora vindobonensis TaxID=195748 RepID=A0ABW5VN93_9MICO
MPTPTDPHALDDAPAARQGICELCTDPGDLVRTDLRENVYLCATHQSAQLRRRLPWRQYLSLASVFLVAVPFLALYAGIAYDTIAAVRSDVVLPSRTLPEAVAYGWGILTMATDHWVSLGIATAVAIALPVSLVLIASQGETVANRVEQASVPNLDDHVRLLYLDNALAMIRGIAMLTTVLTLILAIDAMIDGEPGGAQQVLFCLILSAMLTVEIVKLGAFSNFASKSHLKVTADFALGVSGRRKYARSLDWTRGVIVLAIILSFHVMCFLAATFPAGLAAVGTGLALTLVCAVCTAILAALASLYLHNGDRPTGALVVGVGIFFGMWWASTVFDIAYDKNFHLVNPWGVLLGSGSFILLYLLIALGLISTGPFKGLAYFTARIEDATTALNKATRHTRTKTRRDRTAQREHNTRQNAASPADQEHPPAGATPTDESAAPASSGATLGQACGRQ